MIKIGIGIEWEDGEENSFDREIRIFKGVRMFKGG